MNYAGKFGATFASEGPGTHSHAYAHVDSSQTHAPVGAVIVPDAQLLFHADFSRSGTDLILSKDHHEYVVHDYFTGEKRAPLASPDGAHLTADIVKALVGEVEVSQAGTAPVAGQVIGHVTKLQGSATVIRNGVSIILNMGDNVEKGDVVESGASSTVGITFIDGTVFGLSSNARMVLNEMVYDPNGSNNSSLLSLVAGTITFVAGETAKHGDMKIDTPVATMGIRGTACLVEIDFSVPGQNGQPNASFQVLVEPDGTTGSYILFDKNTLQPIAIVNQAGQQININNGIINITTNPLSPDLQKLITDVFQQKFTDNSTNTKSTSPSTDSIIPTSNPLVIKTAEALITAQTVTAPGSSAPPPPTTLSSSTFHISGPPIVHIANVLGVETTHFLASGELSGLTGSPLPDAAVGIVSFNDINVGDQPSVSAAFGSFTYKNAHGQDVTGGLSALQLADIAATEVKLTITPLANNTNVGSAFFSYSIADQAFDFLAAGEQITLTYFITVNENYGPDPTAKITIPITITITGTNDVPVITTSAQSIAFTPSGTKTVGGDLQTKNATSGTLAFTDVDLTDTHTVATKLTSAVMSDGSTVPPLPESVFEAALSAAIGVDSTGTGAGTINWQLAPLPVYLSDFIPPGQTLTLTYTITVTDSQGAISTQTVTVTISGDNNPAVVWIHTTTDGHDNLWTTANNWETGTVPTSSDDVIIITDQLHPNMPAYPVTIDGTTTAAANLVTMNDFVSLPPELDVLHGGSLTITDALSMSADSILHNAGTITVGGKIELLDSVDSNNKFLALNQSVIVNSGTLNLVQGGDFRGLASITNTGTIDLKGGVLNVLVDIANSGKDANGKPVGGQITVDGGAKLVLGHDANNKATVNGGIAGGTLTIKGELDLQGSNFVKDGTLDNSGNVYVSGLGNSFDNETIANTGTIELKSGAAFAIDQGSSVGGSGTLTIDGTAALTLNDVTISGNTINDYDSSGGGTIDVAGASAINGHATLNNGAVNVDAKLTLDTMTVSGTTIKDNSDGSIELDHTVKLTNGATIQGTSTATLGSITNLGTLEISGAAELLDIALTNTNQTVQVDDTKTLTLDGTIITGGTINDFSSTADGTIDVAGASTINGNATLNNGTVNVDAKLTLDTMTVSGTTMKDNSDGSIELGHTVKLTGGATIQGPSITTLGAITNLGTLEISGAAALTDIALTNGAGTVQVDDTDTLTLDGTTITGGTINDFSSTAGGAIDVAGASSINGNATLNNGTVNVDAKLTLDTMTVSGTTINDESDGSIELDHTVKLTGGATIEGQSSTQLGAITNLGTLEISGAAELLDIALTNGAGTVQVDDTDTLTLDGTTITGGTISDFSSTAGGTIDVAGASTINGNATLNNGTVNVDAKLTLDTMTVSGTTIKDKSDGSIELDHTVKLTNGATIQGTSTATLGAITNLGTLDISGTAALINIALTNTNQTVQVDDTKTLTLDGTTITGGTINDFSSTAGGTIDVAGASTINGNATLNNGVVNVDAKLKLDTMTVSGTTIKDKSDGSIELDNTVKLTGGATIQGTSTATLGAISNLGTLEILGAAELLDIALTNTNQAVRVDDTDTLTLSGTTITGGTINDFSSTAGGTIDLAGASSINGNATLNNGTVNVDAKLTLDTMTVSGTTIKDKSDGGIELDNTVKLTGGATIQGTSTATLGTITNLGTLEILGAATLLDVTVTNTNNNIKVDASQTLDFDNSTINSGTLTVSGELDSTGTSSINNATIINQNNIHVISGTLTIDPSKVTNTGTILVDSYSTLDLQSSEIDGGKITINGELDSSGSSTISGANLVNDGIIDVKGGTLTIDATSVLSGTGGFKMDGGSLALKGALTGNIDIGGAGTFELESNSSTAYSNATVTFDQGSTATLKLDFAKDFGGHVAGFTTNQTLDLADIAYSSKPIVVYTGNASGGVLEVFVNGHDVANINLTGDYTGVQWVLSSDGQGGTDIRESTEGVLAASLDHSTAQQGVTIHVTGVTDGGRAVSSGVSYVWQMSTDGQSWTTIGTSSSFTPGEAQEGHFMQLVVTYTDAAGTQDQVYELGMPNDLTITVDQTTAQQGLPIHVTSVTDGGTAVSSGVTYLWETSTDGHTWTAVGHSSSYTPSFTSDGGKQLQLVVSYTDPGESESVTESFGTVAVAKEWTGGSHSWETGTAWSPANHAGAPASTDNAVVDANGLYTVTVDQSTAAAESLVENASQSTVEIAFGGKLTLGGNLDIDQGNFQVDLGGTLKDVAGSAIISGSFTNNGTVEAGGGKLEIAGTVSGLVGSFKIDAGATLQLDHASSAIVTQIDSGGTLKDIASSATISGLLINNGTVEAGGKLEITDTVSGSGTFKIDAGATLQLDHASSENVAFSGQGTLVLKDPTHFSGIVSDSTGNLTDKDVLDLAGFDTKASVTYTGTTSGGVVRVSEGDKVATIEAGANTTHWTKPVSDGHGGILIEDPVQNDAAPNANTSHAWNTAGVDGFLFKTNPGANAALDADHSPLWPEPDHPDSAGKLAQFLQTHDAAGLPNLPGLLDTVTPDSLKTQFLSHHNEFHFV